MPKSNFTVAKALADHPLYGDFIQVKSVLSKAGHVCWIAGGAVRDMLLGRLPYDFDLVTDATTEQIFVLFPDALAIGASFGVVKLKITNSQFFDLATFRREADYFDGRRPSRVEFATGPEDALRRDFTINALFWDDEEKKVVDFAGGLSDLENKEIKCVGQPNVRFQEDHLRILRLLRFSVQLKFKIESATLNAAIGGVKSLEKISGERIWSELLKMSPFAIWGEFFQNELARTVIQTLFPIQLDRDFEPQLQQQLTNTDLSKAFHLVKFFFVLLRLTKSADLLLKLLKTKLKISKRESAVFGEVQFCLQYLNALKVNDWVYEIEKAPPLLGILEFLSDLGVFGDYSEVNKKYLERPEKIISGNDLVGRVEHVKMAEVLKKIRLLQFEQPNLSKQEILNRLA